MGEATNRVRSTKSASSDPYDVPFDDTGILKVDETPGWELLKRVADPVTDFDTEFKETALSMVPRMYRAHGCGLAAPQVGISKRFLVYDAGNGPTVVVNPVIIKQRGEQFEPSEGCLSLPRIKARIRRPNVISIKAQDINGNEIFIRATELEARILCHEIDHLDGILITDRASGEDIRIITPDDHEDDF